MNFSAEYKPLIRIGRGTQDIDLRVTDISVSRVHAFIKRDTDGYFYLEDNESKFGTLIQVQRPIHLSDKTVYYFQAGRTIFKACVERESGFWDRIMFRSHDDQ